MLRPLVLVAVLCYWEASVAAGQTALAACPSNQLIGDLGIDGLECQDCEINGRPRRDESWIFFHREPRIRNTRPLGPSTGKLQPGDIVVTIDQLPITTRAGSDRYSRLEPGQVVHLEVRRNAELVGVTIVAAPRCGAPSSGSVRRTIPTSGAT